MDSGAREAGGKSSGREVHTTQAKDARMFHTTLLTVAQAAAAPATDEWSWGGMLGLCLIGWLLYCIFKPRRAKYRVDQFTVVRRVR